VTVKEDRHQRLLLPQRNLHGLDGTSDLSARAKCRAAHQGDVSPRSSLNQLVDYLKAHVYIQPHG
jgi:hypothetical protein